ncbi:protein of unknown function [Magnetospirillum gryphiswaldense MSR-1 v2]|uniref:Transposase n=1 Tax=Magnetospirillum gryphiswaldense (strain DSM 6361 / JCM 21280 / NBRC 15271 / MSR-1) TaxID=431944 RepID=V6F6V3_MAGGM|nr:protein of unknown function [Magnetospirillum gryphiswaldense MSR-1 v2]
MPRLTGWGDFLNALCRKATESSCNAIPDVLVNLRARGRGKRLLRRKIFKINALLAAGEFVFDLTRRTCPGALRNYWRDRRPLRYRTVRSGRWPERS